MSVNECCRFCHKNLKRQGVLSHSANIFERTGKAKTVFDRLVDLGLTLTKRPEKSMRTCQKCTNLLSRIERDLPVFRRWVEEEKQIDSPNKESTGISTQTASTAAGKRNREPPPPSKTPTALKKFCPNPPTPPARRCITEEYQSLHGELQVKEETEEFQIQEGHQAFAEIQCVTVKEEPGVSPSDTHGTTEQVLHFTDQMKEEMEESFSFAPCEDIEKFVVKQEGEKFVLVKEDAVSAFYGSLESSDT